jgi:hypothetical protein
MQRVCINIQKRRVILNTQRIIKNFLILTIATFLLLFQVYSANARNIRAEQKYLSVPVRKGDTLWSLAKEYMPDTEVRKAVHMIRKANGLESAIIRRGDVILIPYE